MSGDRRPVVEGTRPNEPDLKMECPVRIELTLPGLQSGAITLMAKDTLVEVPIHAASTPVISARSLHGPSAQR